MIKTSTKKELFREPATGSQRKLGDQKRSEGTSGSISSNTGSVTSGSTNNNTSGSSILNNITQIVVSCGVGTTHLIMAGIDPTI
jgi:hypothetical protein